MVGAVGAVKAESIRGRQAGWPAGLVAGSSNSWCPRSRFATRARAPVALANSGLRSRRACGRIRDIGLLPAVMPWPLHGMTTVVWFNLRITLSTISLTYPQSINSRPICNVLPSSRV